MAGRRSVLHASVVLLAALVVATGPVAGGCAAGTGGAPSASPTPVAGTPARSRLTVLTLAGHRLPSPRPQLTQFGPAFSLERLAIADGDDAAAALRGSRARRADLVVLSSDEWPAVLARSGLVRPLDGERLPGLDAATSAFMATPGAGWRGRFYAVPIGSQLLGIVYDPRSSSPPPASFRALFSRRMTGRVAMTDSPVLGLEIAALALGIRAPTGLDEDQLRQVKILYERRRANFRVFWRRPQTLLHAFRSGTVDVAVATQGNARWLRRHGLRVRFVPGAEGGLLRTDLASIPTGAPSPETAYAFLRMVLSPNPALHGAGTPRVVRPPDYPAWLIAWSAVKQAPPGGG